MSKTSSERKHVIGLVVAYTAGILVAVVIMVAMRSSWSKPVAIAPMTSSAAGIVSYVGPPAKLLPTLTAVLSATSPFNVSVPAGAKSVPFTDFNLTATDGDVGIASVAIMSDSPSALKSLQNIKLYDRNANTLVASVFGLNPIADGTGVYSATINIKYPVLVANNTARTFSLVADVSSSGYGSVRLGVQNIGTVSLAKINVTPNLYGYPVTIIESGATEK